MGSKIDTVILGGTYDPVHIGHLQLAEEAVKAFSPSRVLIVPSYISAHKKERQSASPEHRMKMLEIALKDSGFEIETCELDREGISYSIDTVRYLREKYSCSSAPGLIIGDDLAADFHKWRDAELLQHEAEIILAKRTPGLSVGMKFKHRKIDNLILNISSSDIRRRLKEGQACRYLLPAGVYEYILENKLYGAS